MLFSDNVSIEDERALKEEARERGLLLMGPDCGTAIIGGVPLAFANEVPAGSVGIVSAAGTGLQEVSSLIARLGGGLSHGIGVGGRDLSREVGGIMTLEALDALGRDPRTERIVLISKPPSEEVARRVFERIGKSAKPVTVCFLGLEAGDLPPNARPAATLMAAAEDAAGKAVEPDPAAERAAREASAALEPERKWIRGLYAGGTLCAEAQLVLLGAGDEVRSNAPVPGALGMAGEGGDGHSVVDLGADEYTVGRPHPMIDPASRNELLVRALREPGVAAVLFDVVIGHGAHSDPGGEIARALAGMGERKAVAVASVCGTEDDPQVYSAQVEKLVAAGVAVAPANALAAGMALRVARRGF
jgi:FdrA protein